MTILKQRQVIKLSLTLGLFAQIPLAPPDPIFNLNTSYKADTFPDKINVGVGAYLTNEGKPWVLPAVKKAEIQIINDQSMDHEYLPIDGYKAFTEASARFVLGRDSKIVQEQRYAAVQSVSGTGALRLGAEFLKRYKPEAKVFIPNPTWGPHKTIFEDSNFKVQDYPYYHPQTKGLDIERMLEGIEKAPDGSIFLLHACAHNPTGVDPSKQQWSLIANAMQRKNHFVFFDCAYQGFASGNLDEDAYPIRYFASLGFELFIAQSYSKNFGLYNERAGCLVAVTHSAQQTINFRSQICKIIRALYSNPPAFGVRIVERILNTPSLYEEWYENLQTMVSRIKHMRKMLFDQLTKLKTPGNWDHILNQIGMFTFTGLTPSQAKTLKEKYHIYLTDNGRISMPGLTTMNITYFAESIDQVVRSNC